MSETVGNVANGWLSSESYINYFFLYLRDVTRVRTKGSRKERFVVAAGVVE